MTWIDATKQKPTKPGPHLVYCGRDDCRLPINFIAAWRSGTWWLDDEWTVELDVLAWAEIPPPEGLG